MNAAACWRLKVWTGSATWVGTTRMLDTPHVATNVTIRSALLAGVAIGAAVAVALPALVRRLRGGAAEMGSGAADKGENGTHAVRAGASVRIPRGELTEVVAACLQAAGATAAHAQASAEVLVFADCRGIPSHGVNRADFYAAELEDKLVDGAAEPMVAVDSGCCALVDGRNALGAVVCRRATKPNPNSDPDPSPNPNSHSPLPKPNQVCRRAMELAIAKAREHGVGWVVCKGSNHFGAAGYWAEQAWAILTVWLYSLWLYSLWAYSLWVYSLWPYLLWVYSLWVYLLWLYLLRRATGRSRRRGSICSPSRSPTRRPSWCPRAGARARWAPSRPAA